ncbi:MAG: DUF551 domain-containing protein [Lachnospiraceae bacterium]|nr:DUF551 domain-containing protein [Lachnospiraceae bacterium]
MIEKILSELQEFPHGKYKDDYGKGFSAGINASIEIVQEVAKDGPWVLCSERLPEENKLVLIYAESTARGGSIRCVAELRNGFWFAQIASDTLGLTGIGQYKVIKWAELPEV